MADYLKLIEKGASTVGLDDELALIEALAETAKNWVKLAKDIHGAESLDALLNSLATEIEDARIAKAFADLGLTEAHGTLARLLGKLTEGSAKIPEKYKKLFEPLSKYETAGGGLVEWKLDLDQGAEIGKELKLGVKAGGALQLDAAAKPKIDGTEVGPLLRIGAAADVKATAQGTIPIRWGTIGGSAEASVSVGLDYYFDPEESTGLYAVAVAQRILALPDPFGFDSVWEAFQKRPDLTAIVYTFSDKASAKVDVALSATGSFADKILADVKFTLGAQTSVDNNFSLTLRALEPAPAQAERRIAMVLGRSSASEFGVSAGLQIGIDFSAPLGKVREILNRAVERSDEVLAKITPFLTPGTWLRGEFNKLVEDAAKSLIKDKDLREALVKDMQSLGSAEAPGDPAIVEWLTGKVTGALDDAAKEFTDLGEGARDRLIAKVANALPEPLKGPFREKATVAIAPLVDKATSELKARLQQLIDLPNRALGKALKKIQATASDKIDKLDKAFEGVRNLIDRYNDLLHQAQAFANDAARAKVTASLKIEELWNWGLEEKIVGTYTAPTAEARDIFRRITRGDLETVRALILGGGQAGDPPGFELNRGRSSLKRTAGRTNKADFELVLFGFSMSASTLLSGDASILIDGDGNIQVDAEGGLEKRFKTKNEQREITFVDTFSLLLAKSAQGTTVPTRAIEVGIGLSYIDEKLKPGELTDHVKSLTAAGLVTADTEAVAVAQFQSWSPNGKAIPANLAAKFELSHGQLLQLMMLDQRKNGRLPDAARRKLMDAVLAAGDQLGRRSLKLGRTRIAQFRGIDEKPVPEFMFDRVREAGGEEDLFDEYRRETSWQQNQAIKDFVFEFRRIVSLIGLVETLGEIYEAKPKIGNTPPAGAWDERKYAAKEHEVARYGGRWLYPGDSSGDVPLTTVIFLATICDLLGIPRLVGGKPAAEGVDAIALTFSRRQGEGSVAEEVPLTQTARGALPV